MSEEENSAEYYARKREHIGRDWDAAWRMWERLISRAEAWRRWNVMVVLGYLGIVATAGHNGTGVSFLAVWLPLALTIIAFYFFESSVRAQTFFFDGHIKEVECLFTMKIEKDFQNAICGHKFLFDKRETCKHKDSGLRAWKALWNPWACVWYAGQLVITGVAVYWVVDL